LKQKRDSEFDEPALSKGGFCVRTLQNTPEDIATAAKALQEGNLVGIPTETVYGLAANALNSEACANIFKVKGRPLIDPLIVHVRNSTHAAELAIWNDSAEKVATVFWPGALTLVLPKHPNVPDIVTAGLQTVAIRCPNHPVTQALLNKCGLGLSAPSANPFGYVSPTRAEHVVDSLGSRIPYVIDGGPCEIGIESTILDLTTPEEPKVLRPGAITPEMLSEVLGIHVALKQQSMPEQSKKAAPAPGMLERHYSPKAKLHLLEGKLPNAQEQEARIFLKRPETFRSKGDFWLSEDGKMETITRGVFHLLRSIDAQNYKSIYMEKPINKGLGLALNDRLNRAACKR
jgi:L-threonylcarbamoyladenylate synthase